MKTIRINDFLGGLNVDVLVIDEVITVGYDSSEELIRKYSAESEIPIIMIEGFRNCSMFYRLKTPFEIADNDVMLLRVHHQVRTAGRKLIWGPFSAVLVHLRGRFSVTGYFSTIIVLIYTIIV